MKIMRESATVAFALLGIFLFTVNVAAKTASEIFEKVSSSVVVVHVYDAKGKATGFGSGVVLPGGDVATNCHVVQKASSVKVYRDGKIYSATLRYDDLDRDVCSLSVSGMKAPSVIMGSTRTLKVGSRVYAVGTPKGLELTLSEGIISSLRPVEAGQYLQITAPISPGSSGGGLFDEEGRLIGLTTFYLAEGQQLNFAVPVEWIRELPKRHKKDSKTTETQLDWFSKAMALQEKENWIALMTHAIEWTRALPRDPDAWHMLGFACYQSGQTAKAIEAYQQALRLSPQYADAWVNLSASYYKSGQTANAIEACQQALRINPEHAEAWYNLGVLYGSSGQTAKKIDAYQQALRIDSEHLDAWINLGKAYSDSGQTAKAIEAYQQALRVNPEESMAWNNLGAAYGVLGQYTKAIEACQQALRIKAEYADAWYNLGLTYRKLGQTAQVMEAYKRLKTIDRAKADDFFNKVVLP